MENKLFLALLLLFISLSSGHLYTMDDQTNFHVADALLSRGEISILIPESVRHLNTSSGLEGLRYSYYGIGGPLLFLPLTALGRLAGSLVGKAHYLAQAAMALTNSFLTALAASLLFSIITKLGRSHRAALGTALVYALATPAFVWSKYSYNSVAVGTLFLIALRILLSKNRRRHLAAGLVLGFAVNVRYDAALGAFLLILWSLSENRFERFLAKAAEFAAGLLPFAILLLAHNTARFGSMLELGYPNLESARPFGTPLLTGLSGLLALPTRGILFLSPVLLFSFAGIARLSRREAFLWVSPISLYLIFFAKAETWDAGVAWGPRYLGCVLPFLVAPLAAFLDTARGTWTRRVFASLLALSFLLQVWGSLASMDSYQDYLVENGIDPLQTREELLLAPVFGVSEVIRRFTFERVLEAPPSAALKQGGYPATVALRFTPDYWPFYAWKLGIPAAPLLIGWLLLFSTALLLLARTIRFQKKNVLPDV